MTATNSVALKDTRERVEAAGRLIAAIDKARPEVVIDVELLEVDRTRLREFGLQMASPGSTGISGSADVNRTGLTLENLRNLTAADVLMSGVPGVYYRLLKNDANTRTMASPQLRTSEGIAAQARFGERVPLPVTTFAPIAAGGINQQPITSYVYENIGVNIDITPRMHHDDDVSLALKISLSNISGEGYGGLPTFGNREISTTIRLKDGETNMLAGLIRDDERLIKTGLAGLSDIPLVGGLFTTHRKQTQQTDIILTITPHIVRVLELSESDLRPFRLARDYGAEAAGADLRAVPDATSRRTDPSGDGAAAADSTDIPIPPAAAGHAARHHDPRDATQKTWRRRWWGRFADPGHVTNALGVGSWKLGVDAFVIRCVTPAAPARPAVPGARRAKHIPAPPSRRDRSCSPLRQQVQRQSTPCLNASRGCRGAGLAAAWGQ